MFGADLGVVMVYSAVIMLIFMLAWVLLVPFKLFNKIIVNAALGFVCIFVYNLIANYAKFDFIGINELTALIVSALGVPGFVAIVIIKTVI